jgi:hypothetical protein
VDVRTTQNEGNWSGFNNAERITPVELAQSKLRKSLSDQSKYEELIALPHLNLVVGQDELVTGAFSVIARWGAGQSDPSSSVSVAKTKTKSAGG